MKLAEIERSLPYGFHDAWLSSVKIDYPTRTAELEVDLQVEGHPNPEVFRTAIVEIAGLFYFLQLPPQLLDSEGGMLEISGFDGIPAGLGIDMPETPQGADVYSFYVVAWNSFIVVCAERAVLRWRDEIVTQSPVGVTGGSP